MIVGASLVDLLSKLVLVAPLVTWLIILVVIFLLALVTVTPANADAGEVAP